MAESLEAFTSGFATYKTLSRAVRPRVESPEDDASILNNWMQYNNLSGATTIDPRKSFARWGFSHPNTQSLVIDTTGPLESRHDTQTRIAQARDIEAAGPEGSLAHIHTRLLGAYTAYLLETPDLKAPDDISSLFE